MGRKVGGNKVQELRHTEAVKARNNRNAAAKRVRMRTAANGEYRVDTSRGRRAIMRKEAREAKAKLTQT
jgi:hypothetical protein